MHPIARHGLLDRAQIVIVLGSQLRGHLVDFDSRFVLALVFPIRTAGGRGHHAALLCVAGAVESEVPFRGADVEAQLVTVAEGVLPVLPVVCSLACERIWFSMLQVV